MKPHHRRTLRLLATAAAIGLAAQAILCLVSFGHSGDPWTVGLAGGSVCGVTDGWEWRLQVDSLPGRGASSWFINWHFRTIPPIHLIPRLSGSKGLGFIVVPLWPLVSLLAFLLLHRAERRRSREGDLRCVNCRYSLRGIARCACPECGHQHA